MIYMAVGALKDIVDHNSTKKKNINKIIIIIKKKPDSKERYTNMEKYGIWNKAH